MRWFEGTIPEAIAEAKSRRAVFVVYISGEDERSLKMNTTFESEEVSSKLEQSGCVAVRLQGNSEVCQQFSQIYPVVLIPSTYFIADNGMPLEIIGGDVPPQEFLTKVDTVIQTLSASSSVQSVTHSTESNPDCEVPAVENENRNETKSPQDQQPSSSNESVSTSSTSASFSSIDERVERAKQSIAQLKEQKEKVQREEEKQKELERRKAGQEVQKQKHRQQDVEARQLADDLAKERAEERAARERIREQIATDRAERAVKYQADKKENERLKLEQQQAALQEQQARAADEAAERSNHARLQFRFPDGSSMTHQFSADDTLEAARIVVRESSKLNVRAFTLSTTFPKREFQEEDYSQTLRELRLAPCSAIMVLPQSSMGTSTSRSISLLWTLLGPLFAIFNFLRALVYGSPPTQVGGANPQKRSSEETSTKDTDSSKEGQSKSTDGGQKSNKSNAYKRHAGDNSSFSRRDGNVHRIANQDDEDENNTWNGNSTQQM